MANKTKKTQNADAPPDAIAAAIVSSVQELYAAHAGEIEQVKDESETKKVTVNFASELDFSESAPTVKTRIKFSQSVTDSRVAYLDDPNQLTLLTPEQDKTRKAIAKEESAGKSSGEGE